jgi:hypothetical protein
MEFIGREETINLRCSHIEDDISKRHVDPIIRKNIIPPRPIYLLAILQSLESIKPGDYGLTSYGYCYQYLIQQSLYKAKIDGKNLDTYINYLTELAFFIYKMGHYNRISKDQ